jgi:hypothetical protein
MQSSARSAKTTLKISRDPTWFKLYEIKGRLQRKTGHSLTFDQVIEALIESYLSIPEESTGKA